jgi:hypothetical protein
MKISAIILLIITGGLTYISFNLFQSPPSLGYLFHFYNALFIFILGIILYFIGSKRHPKITWWVPLVTASFVFLPTFINDNKACMLCGTALTFLCLVAIIVTLVYFILKEQ